MRVEQRLERVEILRVDDRVERLVSASLEAASAGKPRIDGVAEFGNDDQVLGRHDLGLGLLCAA